MPYVLGEKYNSYLQREKGKIVQTKIKSKFVFIKRNKQYNFPKFLSSLEGKDLEFEPHSDLPISLTYWGKGR